MRRVWAVPGRAQPWHQPSRRRAGGITVPSQAPASIPNWMSWQGKRGLALLGLAIVLGVVGDVLFDGHSLGVNVLLFAVCFVAALALLLRLGGASRHQGRRWLAAPLLLFAAAFLWHSSPLLTATNILALAGAVTLGALRRTEPRPQDAGIADYAAGLAAAGAGAFAGGVQLMQRDVPWAEATRGLRHERVGAIGRGLAIGIPVVALFGGLFIAADSVFERLVTAAIPTGLVNPWPHLVVGTAIAWLAAGLLRDLAADREEERLVSPEALTRKPIPFRLGSTEVIVALAALDLLFLAFVLVQARYLFGGSALVEAQQGLTYAQYARHGFFELVAVTVLVVPVVLAANTLARDRLRAVRGLSAALVVLELVVAASALQRLRVYVHQFGLTELRIYASGVVIWLAVVLVWALATVLRGRGRRFAVGAVVAGFAASAALNVANPDALIAKTNLARPSPDAAYLSRLSDDAVPTLLARLPTVRDPVLRHTLAQALLARHVDRDLLGWNAAREHARTLLAQHQSELRRLASG
jgi:hypothetical protein